MTISPLRLTAILLAASSLTAQAQDNELTPVTVTASRTAALTESLPTGVVTLEREEIENSPATNLADVLDSVGGIDTRRQFGINGTRASIDMLGFGAAASSNTLILLNGRRYNNSDSSTPDLNSIPLAAIERIEITPGAGAALYGNGAVGGAINIVTRENYRNQAGAEVGVGDFHTRQGNAWATIRENNLGGAAAVDALNSDGYRDNNALKQRNGFLDLRADTDAALFTLTGTVEEQELGLPGGRNASFTSNNTDFHDNPEGADNPNDWADQQGFTVSPGMMVSLTDYLNLHLDASRRHRSQQAFFDDPMFPFYGETDVDSYNLNPRLVMTGNTLGLSHNLTLGWDRYEYDYKSRSAASEDQISNPSSINEVDQKQKGWYLHDTIALGDHWTLTAGARELDVVTEKDSGTGEERTSTESEMYEGGVRYSPLGSFSIFAGAQRSVRILNADEIRFDDPDDFVPQTGRTYTLGASWKENRQHSTLTLWRGRFEDEIVFDPNAGMFGANVNLEDPTQRKGVSLNSRWELDDDLMLTLNGTYQRATFEGGDYEHNEVPLVPRQTAHVRADWQAQPWLRLSVAHRYTGKRRLDNDQTNESRRLDSYRMTDLILRAEEEALYMEVGVYNLEDNLAADYGIRTGPSTYNAFPLPEKHVLMKVGLKL